MEKPTYEIVPATSNDLNKIVDLNVPERKTAKYDTFTIEDWFQLGNWQGNEDILQWHFNQMKNTGGNIFVAKTPSGELLGEIEYVVEKASKPLRWHIFWLIVAPKYRRKGIAQQLIAHLVNLADKTPVWVESEDTRTDKLYQKLGKKTRILKNFALNFTDINHSHQQTETFKISSLAEIYSRLDELVRVIGQYNIPSFDMLQLINSRQTIIEPIIWGEDTPEIYKIKNKNLDTFIILTQYLRVYSVAGILPTKKILKQIIFLANQKEYPSLKLQIYRDENLIELLKQLDFVEEEETNDPIYRINAVSIE